MLHYPCSLNLKQALMGWGFTKVQSHIAFCANSLQDTSLCLLGKVIWESSGGNLLDVIMIDINALYRFNWEKKC